MKAPIDFNNSQDGEARDWIVEVLAAVGGQLPAQFTGLGLVLYRPPFDIPTVPLAPKNKQPKLPTESFQETVALLRELTDYNNPLHDGFHLIEVPSFRLTHVCQFLSPPISQRALPKLPDTPMGARQMAAILVSLLPSVVLAAVLGDRRRGMIIQKGKIDSIEIVPR